VKVLIAITVTGDDSVSLGLGRLTLRWNRGVAVSRRWLHLGDVSFGPHIMSVSSSPVRLANIFPALEELG
jgi:hypothetical protein